MKIAVQNDAVQNDWTNKKWNERKETSKITEPLSETTRDSKKIESKFQRYFGNKIHSQKSLSHE